MARVTKSRPSQSPPRLRLPSPAAAALLATQPVEFFNRLHNKHGSVVGFKLAGFGEVLSVVDPDLIKSIYANHQDAFAGQASNVLGPILGDNSVLLLDQDPHMRQRKLMLPPFHGESLRGYESAITQIAKTEIATWSNKQTFALRPRMQTITLEVILQVIFGISDKARRDRYSLAIDRLMALTPLLAINPVGAAKGSKLSFIGVLRKRLNDLDLLIFEDVAARRGAADSEQPANDVLSLLLAATDEQGNPMTDAELRDQLVSLLFAGHETTATALAWTMDLLLWNPDVYARATEAARADDSQYLDALCKESLRLRPVVWSTGRIVQRPMKLGEWTIPAKTRIWSPMSAIAMNPELYPEPTRLRPERFIDGGPPSYAWVPFGGGIRRCLGAAFAATEMRIVLQEMLTSGTFEPAAKRPEKSVLRTVTLAPARGTRVKFVGLNRTICRTG